MAVRPVHWEEGMFLRPHHFQAEQRYMLHLSHLSGKWDLHYDWGLRQAQYDLEALANYRFVVRFLQARLPDGTLVAVPEDGTLPILDLQPAFEELNKPAFEGQNGVTVYLGVPVSSLGKANVAKNGNLDGARYLLEAKDQEDENTGLHPQLIQFRCLNLKLLLSTEGHSGYVVLPIARIKRGEKEKAIPELDVTYIPPVLACDAWYVLQAQILQQIYERIGAKIQVLADRVIAGNISHDSTAAGDARLVAALSVLNEAYAFLGIMAFAEGVHPLTAYFELSRLVGQLAIFGHERRPPALPKYDHDNLGYCFYTVKKYIDALLDIIIGKLDYEERPFVGAGLRMQVALEGNWLEPAYQMFVGVKTPLGVEECIRTLTRGGLDMKIGSSERVEEIFRFGIKGLSFSHCHRPPRALPNYPGLIYFQIARESQIEEWQHVRKTLNLAIRLNELRVASDIQGQKELTIRTRNNQTTTMQFILYVIKEQKAEPEGKSAG
jgi:type VI secretion system protein ImpJ